MLAYRKAWRAKRDEVDAAIAANAEQEELVDQPEVVKGIVRVSGPFTVEALQPAEESLGGASPVDGPDDDLETFAANMNGSAANAEAYLDKMIRLLKADGVRFPNNVQVAFDRLDPVSGGLLNAAGEWRPEGPRPRPATSPSSSAPNTGRSPGRRSNRPSAPPIGPRSTMISSSPGSRSTRPRKTVIQDDPNPKVRCHLAFIRPDVNLNGLLKETPNSQLFTVFGLPRARLEPGRAMASTGS